MASKVLFHLNAEKKKLIFDELTKRIADLQKLIK